MIWRRCLTSTICASHLGFGLVGYVRRNFLVPIPSFESFDSLNAYLERRCLERTDAQLRGHTETIGQRMERDLDVLLPLPDAPYDACERQAGRVSSLPGKVQDQRPLGASGPRTTRRAGERIRGPAVISCGSEVIARHPRSYERDDFVYDPSTTCRCWSGRRAPWTRPLHCRDGTSPRSSAR